MTLNPQKEFYTEDGTNLSNDCKQLRSLTEQPWFRRSLAAALATMASQLPATPLQQQSCDSWNQIVGARRYMDTLLNLTESPEKPRIDQPRLRYDA